jgi:superfamily II DNA or RNA helicase
MAIDLYTYQANAVKAVANAFKDGVNKSLVVLPTGTGKTIVMAAIAYHYNKKALVLAHRDELIKQAKKDFTFYNPSTDIGICKAESNDLDHQIIIGSIQTCLQPKRLAQLKAKGFDLLIIDEAHHAASDSYLKIIQELGFNDNDNKLLVGATATPERNDKRQLSDVFSEIVYQESISDMIKLGYLPPVIGRKILTSFSLKGIKSHTGDFAVNELATRVDTKERNKFVVRKYHEHAKKRKAIIFCANVSHAKSMAKAFNDNGLKVAAVWGSMPKNDRTRILNQLKTGKLNGVTCASLLTEGYDEPSINCVVMACPTRSSTKYRQCIGRGMRRYPEKENCLVLDFQDITHKIGTYTLEKEIPEATCIIDAEAVNQKEVDRNPRIKTLVDHDEEFNVLAPGIKLRWVNIGDGEFSLVDDCNNFEIVLVPRHGGYIAHLYEKTILQKNLTDSALPLEHCQGMAEEYARKHMKVRLANPRAEWLSRREPATERQLVILQNVKGLDLNLTKAQASHEIGKLFALRRKKDRLGTNRELITTGQKSMLEGLGIEHTDTMTKNEASILIYKHRVDSNLNHTRRLSAYRQMNRYA